MIMVIDIKLGVMLNEVLRKSFSQIVIRWSGSRSPPTQVVLEHLTVVLPSVAAICKIIFAGATNLCHLNSFLFCCVHFHYHLWYWLWSCHHPWPFVVICVSFFGVGHGIATICIVIFVGATKLCHFQSTLRVWQLSCRHLLPSFVAILRNLLCCQTWWSFGFRMVVFVICNCVWSVFIHF